MSPSPRPGAVTRVFAAVFTWLIPEGLKGVPETRGGLMYSDVPAEGRPMKFGQLPDGTRPEIPGMPDDLVLGASVRHWHGDLLHEHCYGDAAHDHPGALAGC